jgi:hypothetical protein
MEARKTYGSRARRIAYRVARREGQGSLDAMAVVGALVCVVFICTHLPLHGWTHSSIPIIRDASVQISTISDEVRGQYATVVDDPMLVSERSSIGNTLRGKTHSWQSQSQPAQQSIIDSVLSLLDGA